MLGDEPLDVTVSAFAQSKEIADARAYFLPSSEGGPALVVSEIGVDEKHRGCGVATRMYEALAKEACRVGVPLVSDQAISEGSQGFWNKQVRKGRATKRADTYTMSEPCAHKSLRGLPRRPR